MHPMNVGLPAKFQVRTWLYLFLSYNLIAGSQIIGAVPGYAHTLYYPLPEKIYAYHTDYLSM